MALTLGARVDFIVYRAVRHVQLKKKKEAHFLNLLEVAREAKQTKGGDKRVASKLRLPGDGTQS